MPSLSNLKNHQVLLAARQVGFPKDTDLRYVESPIPRSAPGQVLCRTIYLSLDPYMRGRMNVGPRLAPWSARSLARRGAGWGRSSTRSFREGSLTYREDIVEGLEHAVPAFQGLLNGKNFGKLLVRVASDPTR